MNTITTYLQESYDELLHRVTWPTAAELQQSTTVVLGASVFIALLIWLMDSGTNFLLQKLVY